MVAKRDIWEALSDASRREILLMLREKPLAAGEIAKRFSLTKPTISHHLALLREAGLIFSKREGQFLYYSLMAGSLSPLEEYLSAFSYGDGARAKSHSAKTDVQEMGENEKEDETRSSVPVYLY